MKLAAPHPPSLADIRGLVRPICQRYSVAKLAVFGSVARADAQSGSDVDFLVDFLPESKIGLFEMGGMKEDLEETLGCPVDLVTRTAVEHSRTPYRRNSILAAPVIVYGE